MNGEASFQVASPSPPDLHSGRTKIGETLGGAEGVGKSTDFADFLSLTDTSYAVSLEVPPTPASPAAYSCLKGRGVRTGRVARQLLIRWIFRLGLRNGL